MLCPHCGKETNFVSPKRGQKFKIPEGDIYILALVGIDCMALVGLNDGNRWKDFVRVKDIYNITLDEWRKIAGEYGKMERVN